MMQQLPDDMLYYILSFTDKKYDNLLLKPKQRCIYKTKNTNYKNRCKRKAMYNNFCCWHHCHAELSEKLIALK